MFLNLKLLACCTGLITQTKTKPLISRLEQGPYLKNLIHKANHLQPCQGTEQLLLSGPSVCFWGKPRSPQGQASCQYTQPELGLAGSYRTEAVPLDL